MSEIDIWRAIHALEEAVGNVKTPDVLYRATGTWPLALQGSTIAGVFVYGATTAGTYTRLGNTVFIRGRIAITTVTTAPTGNLRITGLPFTAATTTNGTPGAAQFTYWSLCNLGGGAKVYLAGLISSGQTRIDLVVSDSAGGAAVALTGAVAGVAPNTDLIFTGQYEV